MKDERTRLKEIYAESVVPALMKKFEYSNVMEIPKIEKVVISVGCETAGITPKCWML